jgi:RND family efflux transporter MFP subunit
MNDSPEPPLWRRALGIFLTTLVCLAILAASVAGVVVINRTEPTAQQINMTRKSAALVETVVARRATWSPKIAALGTVQAAQDIVLSPRVSGQVIELSASFVPGGMVRKNDLLLRIDPADFENAVSIRESELAQAEASLKIEEGRESLAKKELALLEGTIDGANRALVLREPQMASIRAEVKAAEAAVERAKLDLQRSSVYAPFDAQILSRSVNVGSQVATGDELAQLVGVEEYWIMAAVPVRSLRWVKFPSMEGDDVLDEGSAVILRDPDAWSPGTERHARVARMIGTLDQQSRLARILITIDDPLGRKSDAPPLILGTLIQTEIEGVPLENVVRLRREYVHEQDTVWVMVEGKLKIVTADVVFRDADYAYIRSGLQDGDEVVITTLATVSDGVGLRKIEASETVESSEPATDSVEEASE